MEIRYKWVKKDWTTYNDTQWGPYVQHKGTGTGSLCSKGWIHVYNHPLLAVLFKPLHINDKYCKLVKCIVSGKSLSDGFKEGWECVMVIEQIAIPKISREKKIMFAILCVKKVYNDEDWNKWADDWLSGKNRAAWAAARTAADAAGAAWAAARTAAGRAAAEAAADAATWAAGAAARTAAGRAAAGAAARAAARAAAGAAGAARAAGAAGRAAAGAAAEAAARAADAAGAAQAANINFIEIAKKVMES